MSKTASIPTGWRGQFALIAAPDGREGAVTLHQDVSLYAARLATGDAIEYQVASPRRAWLQVATGHLRVNGEALVEGDGAAFTPKPDGALLRLELEALEPAEVLLFDLAGTDSH
jgi:redox-sensitive bicupin YhaK (pirin superfamily)